MLEIRGHARGGQGMVTAFEILAKIFSQSGEYQVQAFPAFGVERTGAPIQAFLRIAKGDILNRSNIYHPHLVVVFDETLIEMVPVFDGLRKNGAILLNTERDLKEFSGKADSVYTIPATRISLEKDLGSKSLPIVNAAMIGAIIRILNSDIESAKEIIAANVPAKSKSNQESSFQAYREVIGLDKENTYLVNSINSSKEDYVETFLAKPGDGKSKINLKELPRVPFWSQPMSKNKTGNWRVLTPSYVNRTAPCTSNCPAGTDVRLFVKQTSEGKFEEAYKTIYEHNPFPSTCGRVCPHFCEQNCNRIELDEGLNVGAIERFLGDLAFDKKVKRNKIIYKEKIAVIGAGPAGLTAALRLTQKGYETIVFEAHPYAGGMMRSGIPQFRLPQDILDKEITIIKDEGVKIVLNKKVTIKDIENDFDAVVVSVGSHIGTKMNIPNEEMVIDGIEFLHKFKMKGDNYGVSKGDSVAIVGGGNTAIDVARTSLRLGGKPTIYYRRTRKEMPAIAHEVNEALAEGVNIEFLTAPVGINQHGKIELTMIKMELGEPDESGRRRPIPIKGSEKDVIVDKVIAAIGQRSDEFVFADNEIKPVQGKVEYQSNISVFCSGDMAWGGTVTEAIGSGNKVAEEVNASLRGLHYSHEDVKGDIVVPTELNFTYFLPTPRTVNPVKKSSDFYNDFEEVVKSLTKSEIIIESKRCLHCGDCYSCGNCFNYCPDAAIYIDDENRIRIDYDFCKGCGICAHECPCSAINFELNEVIND
jgi:2-oxoacid:acceptor oxidoreductase gamma subunit (pyruvate/2-ketoisovalerate family)/2-oxoacid:acceptor oxidoreductase delta subunit (pyruvate/2-ketoisovalerate family)